MVFSGIIEEVGSVVSLTKRPDVALWDGSVGEGWVLVVAARAALVGAYLGASIAVNGTCLTVTAFDEGSFTVGLAPETMRRTNLGDLAPGSPVNLERALPADGRNSGHYVQGHVDGTGVIESFTREGDSLWVRVGSVPAGIIRHVLPKGFIAVDGTSLTVCDVHQPPPLEPAEPATAAAGAAGPGGTGGGAFTFMLIAHTQAHVALPRKAVGDRVNLEADVLGKYAAAAADAAVARLAGAVAALEGRLTSALAGVEARLAALEAKAGLGAAAGAAAAAER